MTSDPPRLVPREVLFGNPGDSRPRHLPARRGANPALVGATFTSGALPLRHLVRRPVEQMAAMRDRGIDHAYVLLPDEGHALVKPENQLRVTAATERFVAKHLGGRCEQ